MRDLLSTSDVGEPPLVPGHSYGAIVATAYASRFPVRGVIATDQTLTVTSLPAEIAEGLRGPGHRVL
ncbi:hypothetical protein [Paractinoplanes abujensis]|uniref:Pimeloyl-ACP methyl ester carboxylesterase n=1 Tax=Paractinoplanes abujensis TaxID=882441 RepID=A0A7W7CR91_9ACTN|nr:hypothetical protein [Actinoplanes abujensis]MBB4693178.1 pimeloyl-ACP methyl ester carboxylesterase [Actinoplanes abujensis]